jgi:RNA polymerase sigma-70 factor (ECF subfamily)
LKNLVDCDLVAQAAAGSRDAFATIVRAPYDAIYRMAWRWVGFGLAKAIRSFRGDAEFSTWLFRLTYNASLDFLRSRKRSARNHEPEVVVLFERPAGASPEASAIETELWTEVRNLPGQQRDAVLLVYAEDMSHADAARVMGCSEKTVSWHLHEARKRLKARLQEAG